MQSIINNRVIKTIKIISLKRNIKILVYCKLIYLLVLLSLIIFVALKI